MAYLQLIRPVNLLIVLITQYFLYYFILMPFFQNSGVRPLLDPLHFFLLSITTVLIAAGGYVINDLSDHEIDRINRPDSLLIGEQISTRAGFLYYVGVSLIGLLIAVYLAFYIRQPGLVLIYPVAVGLLYWYSKKLKGSVLSGNVVVGLFCAFVAGIVWFAEREAIAATDHRLLVQLLAAYCLFAFLSTVFREIVKDVEDMEGDRQLGCRTLPIVYGERFAWRVARWVAISLFVLLIPALHFLWSNEWWWDMTYILLAILAPLAYVIFKMGNKPGDAKHKRQISLIGKFIMLTGLLYLIIFSFHA